MQEKNIHIKNARLHNLKNVYVEIPRNRFSVVTGVSGSGKSSLIFNTLYAEGQRRYVESLSSYARQFLGRLEKPEVDQIQGLTPCIAIEQKVNTRNPRSTVATSTELYDYLKLLWARIGKTISPISGEEVKKHQSSDVIQAITAMPAGRKVYICYRPLTEDPIGYLSLALQKGYSRVWIGGKAERIEEVLGQGAQDYYVLVDRLKTQEVDEEYRGRLSDSVETAFWEGKGEAILLAEDEEGVEREQRYNNRFELDGILFEEPSVDFLSFNNPFGACKKCEGFGSVIGIDPDLVIPNRSLSVFDNAVAPWKGETLSEWKNRFIYAADAYGFPIHRPVNELSNGETALLWNGNEQVEGLHAFFRFLEEKSYKIQYRVLLAKYRGKTVCDACHGTRIRQDASYVKLINGQQNPSFMPHPTQASLQEVLLLTIDQAAHYFAKLQLDAHAVAIVDSVLTEIRSRLDYLQRVGIGYLGLNRLSNSLSGGESQRINLATSLGSALVGSTYILDEPSIGLHSKDTERLLSVLQDLKAKGNTVVVVEHDEDVMTQADHLIDMGPEAGNLGGEVVFSGKHADLATAQGLTAEYLTGKKQISVPEKRRSWNNRIEIIGASHNNLKGVDVTIPLKALTVVSGVSGSGKTSLVKGVIYPAVLRQTQQYSTKKIGAVREIKGDLDQFQSVEMVDQNPIGKSSRSNPVTYVKAYDSIRELFASMPAAKQRGYKAKHFSFNVDGGRCEKCQGEGEEIVEMQFMADLHLVCEDCKGRRFKDEILDVEYRKRSIHEVLDMTVDEAISFFEGQKGIVRRLAPLSEVGLGYVKLGQSSSTLSGGEAQRIKLATFLSRSADKDKVMFIFDEPTTGLHFHDINKLLRSFYALIEKGHTVLVIEHNLDVIKCADWVIDLGPEGGEEGGRLVFQGTPEDLAMQAGSYTATYLRSKLA